MKHSVNRTTCGLIIVLTFAIGNAYAQNAESGKMATKQSSLVLAAVGDGQKVKLTYKGKVKIVNLENDFAGSFIAGGEPPYHYNKFLSFEKDSSLYYVATFRSGPAITDPNAPCGGDSPLTLLLIQASKTLKVEKIQTEIYQSCAFNGSGRELKGKPHVTKNRVTIAFDEGSKRHLLTFDASEADKGLQLTDR